MCVCGLLARPSSVLDSILTITGHSLEGAVAVIAAAALQDLVKNPIVTFGSPRVGNSFFVGYI
jgi:hypothetical protein